MPSELQPCASSTTLKQFQTTPPAPASQALAAGQWRCATSSLQFAFETILSPPLAPSMHGAYLMPRPHLIALLNNATLEPDANKRTEILKLVYSGYHAASDWPGFVFLEDLIDLYPDVKIILNKRKPESWRKSCLASLHFFSTFRLSFYHGLDSNVLSTS